MPEWPIGLVSKTMRLARGTGVQIPLPPLLRCETTAHREVYPE